MLVYVAVSGTRCWFRATPAIQISMIVLKYHACHVNLNAVVRAIILVSYHACHASLNGGAEIPRLPHEFNASLCCRLRHNVLVSCHACHSNSNDNVEIPRLSREFECCDFVTVTPFS